MPTEPELITPLTQTLRAAQADFKAYYATVSIALRRREDLRLRGAGNEGRDGNRVKDESKWRYETEVGQKKGNVPLNRYNDVLPYDSNLIPPSRIHPHTYINASPIVGPSLSLNSTHVPNRTYIASQGPLPITSHAFLSLFFPPSSSSSSSSTPPLPPPRTIVMLTPLTEGGRVKCSRYWPSSTSPSNAQIHQPSRPHLVPSSSARSSHLHSIHPLLDPQTAASKLGFRRSHETPSDDELEWLGAVTNLPTSPITVELERSEDVRPVRSEPGWRVNTLRLRRGGKSPTGKGNGKEVEDAGTGVGEEVTVQQYEYLGWADHGVPDDLEELVHLVDAVESSESQSDLSQSESTLGRPIVVHCSAGVGRTGTYITLAHLLPVLRAEIQSRHSRSSASPSQPDLTLHPTPLDPAWRGLPQLGQGAGEAGKGTGRDEAEEVGKDVVARTVDWLREQRRMMCQGEQVAAIYKALMIAEEMEERKGAVA